MAKFKVECTTFLTISGEGTKPDLEVQAKALLAVEQVVNDLRPVTLLDKDGKHYIGALRVHFKTMREVD